MDCTFRVILLLIFPYSILFSQTNKLDSLVKAVTTAKSDTSKINAWCDVAKFVYSVRKRDSLQTKIAIESAKNAIKLSQKINFPKGEVNSYLQLGNIYFKGEDYIKAFEMFQNGLKISELKNMDVTTATLCNKVGYIHVNIMNNPSKAKGYFEKALKIYEKEQNKLYIGRVLVNLSIVYSKLKDYQQELDYSFRAYKLFSELNDSASMAIVTGNLGDGYIKSGQYDKAVKFIKLSKATHEKLGSEIGMVYNDLRLGTVYYHLKDYKNAESYLKICNDFAKRNSNYELIANSSEVLYKVYKELNDKNQEMCFQNEFFKAKDSISNLEKLTKISEIENNRSLEKLEDEKELEIVINKLKSDEEKQRQNLLLLGILIILLVSTIFSWVILKRFRVSKEQNIIIQKQKLEVENKSELLEEKQKEILDSIHYAKRIQTTLLAHQEFINEHLKENFVLFRPKDIVSGDFYWATKKNHLFYLGVCDSTGHGVPGAFMSLLSITFLNEAINERNIVEPNEVFNYVRKKLIESVSRDGQKDGFDGILICYNTKTKGMTYAAANNSPAVVSSESFEELPSDRMPVGDGIKDEPFKLYEINLKPSQTLYLYTDGYADQFGGLKGKKFMYKRLNELLVSVSNKSMVEQESVLNETFDTWKKDLEQIDDVCIVGLKV